MALGCIQALECHTNRCPTGVATQDKSLIKGLVINEKKQRIANYHDQTLKNFVELLGAAGIKDSDHLTRSHIYRRVFMNKVHTFEDIYPSMEPGAMIHEHIPEKYQDDFKKAFVESWH